MKKLTRFNLYPPSELYENIRKHDIKNSWGGNRAYEK